MISNNTTSLAARILERLADDAETVELSLYSEFDEADLGEEVITEIRAKKMVKFVVRQGKKIKLKRFTCPKRAGYIATVDPRRQCVYRMLKGSEKARRNRAIKRTAKKGTTKRQRKISTRRRSLLNIKRKTRR